MLDISRLQFLVFLQKHCCHISKNLYIWQEKIFTAALALRSRGLVIGSREKEEREERQEVAEQGADGRTGKGAAAAGLSNVVA